ncbi:MAG: hypothetical protein AAB035_00285 [Nitrospirota bacterium]
MDSKVSERTRFVSDTQFQNKVIFFFPCLLYKVNAELFDQLDFDDDNIFLEPLLFAYFTDPHPVIQLEQILFGYIPEETRPKMIHVYANSDGIVELPIVGSLHTSIHNATLRLVWRNGFGNCVLENAEGSSVTIHSRSQPVFAEGTSIEICRYNHPLLERFFVNDAGQRVDVDIENITRLHFSHISCALDLIKGFLPDYYKSILAVTRRIMVYSGKRPFSFATVSAHGIVFLNASKEDNQLFFLEDIIHQCGHIIFSAMTIDPQKIIKIQSHTPLNHLNGDKRDGRDIYTTLHGVFTEAWMNLCLDRGCDSKQFPLFQRHELFGRFALIFTRFGCDLKSLMVSGLFTEQGQQLFNCLTNIYQDIVSRRYNQLSQIKISNQKYCFSRADFLRLNPLDQ